MSIKLKFKNMWLQSVDDGIAIANKLLMSKFMVRWRNWMCK